jgi:hypothetical protein
MILRMISHGRYVKKDGAAEIVGVPVDGEHTRLVDVACRSAAA